MASSHPGSRAAPRSADKQLQSGASSQRLPRSSPRRRTVRHYRLLGVAILLGLWSCLSLAGVGGGHKLPSPSAVLKTAADMTASGELPHAVAISAFRAMTGLAFGVTVGTVLAVMVGLSSIAEALLDSPLQILRSLPAVALVPVFIAWFGIGEPVKILLIGWATAFPIYLSTLGAIRNIDGGFYDLARSVGMSGRNVVSRIILPGSLPGWFAGLRYAFALAWILLIVSEQVNATSGLGFLTAQARLFYQTDVLFVCLIVYGLLGWLSDVMIRVAEARALRWRRPFRPVRKRR